MTINVDFDIIIVAIFVTIFITGFIRGGGIEFLRVAKIVIPFIILYFFGDKITNLLFSSPKIVQFVYDILPNVPYRNTIASLSTKILLYIVVYLFLAILLWRLGKYVLDERIEYYFGRYNSILGGIFALIRMYIIISIIIIPFYALNFTNQHDPLTKFIINHPPRFSRIGILLDKARPTVDKLNEVTSSLKIMDIKSLEKYTRLVYDVKDFVTDTEKEAYDLYNYLLEEKVITEDYNQREFLIYYLNNLTFFQELTLKNKEMHNLNKSLYDKVSTYKQVYIWAYEKHVLEMESEDEVIESFIHNYNEIAASTNDELSIEMLTKLKFNVKLYLVLKEWLATSFDISISSTSDLLNDGNIENILDNYHLYENYLIELINNEFEPKEQELILSQLARFRNFQTLYLNKYKPQIMIYEKLMNDVSFKYKLTFAILKDTKFNQLVDKEMPKESIIYLFVLDSLDFFNRLTSDNQIYYETAQIYVALFLIDIDQDLQVDPMTSEKVIQQLKYFSQNEDLYNRTKKSINEIIRTLLIEREGHTYLEYLIEQEFCEPNIIDELLASEIVKMTLSYENFKLLENMKKN